LVVIGIYRFLVPKLNGYRKSADMTKQENYDLDAISKEWEKFETEKLQFLLQTQLREFGYKCIENKHELCKGCKCLCHFKDTS